MLYTTSKAKTETGIPRYPKDWIYKIDIARQSDIERICTETKKNSSLAELNKLIQEGWLEHRGQLTNQAMAYWDYRYHVTVIDTLIVRNNRICDSTGNEKMLLEEAK